MNRQRIIRQKELELSAGGYSTVLVQNMHSCADIFAERKGKKLAIKVVHNIDSVTRKEAETLQKLSRFLDAEPLILASVSKNRSLDPRIEHYRFGVRCIHPSLLPDIDYNEPRLFASKAVSAKVRIDSDRLRALRKTSSMNLAELAAETRISKATLYKHEENDAYASLQTVSRLEKALGGQIAAGDLTENKTAELPMRWFVKTGMRSLRLEIAPFDIVAKKKNYYEIGLQANARTMIKRAALFKAMKDTFEGNFPFFINDKKSGRVAGMPSVGRKELAKVGSEEELLDLVY